MKLTKKDEELIEIAKDCLEKNYDGYVSTIASAVRCRNGKIYTGVDIYVIHGSCAEFIAMGAAKTAGEKEFDCIVAVGLPRNLEKADKKDMRIMNMCGNCRQMLNYIAKDITAIVEVDGKKQKVTATELLPFEYKKRGI